MSGTAGYDIFLNDGEDTPRPGIREICENGIAKILHDRNAVEVGRNEFIQHRDDARRVYVVNVEYRSRNEAA